ncbi:hypothetical protein PMIT1327_00063 [Prochlorococcus marinus str. MIT 1327]|nr:hypothetical protein PMIT1312_00060 [Prochlorococcus marinus str. MIT 1312]KZR84590.1 hypothetical protein PMIT1327_00063 [Prochlorococcus marinus str. MIT 1327]
MRSIMLTELINKLVIEIENYLCARFDKNWTDFLLMPGYSDVWITALVVTLTESTSNKELIELRSVAFDNLDSYAKSNDYCVGYNKFTPPDCDSSIWLARSYQSMRRNIPEKLIHFINNHRIPNQNKCSTYIISDGIAEFIGLENRQVNGWYSSHDCVELNYHAIHSYLLGQDDESDFLNNNSIFSSYWWPTDAYLICFDAKKSTSFDTMMIEHSSTFINSFENLVAINKLSKPRNFVELINIINRAKSYAVNDDQIIRLSYLIDQFISDPCEHSWMILPMPDHENRDKQAKWDLNGLVQGAALPDVNGVFSSSLLLSLCHSFNI